MAKAALRQPRLQHAEVSEVAAAMNARYAQGTDVPMSRSREEIERTVTRFGARSFAYGWEGDVAVVGFRLGEWQYRFEVPLPDRTAPEFTLTPARRNRRSPEDAERAWEQATRERWRALALIVKAKFAAVEAGISTVEREFLGNIVLPDGRTVAQHALPAVAEAYAGGHVPPMLAITSGEPS